MNKILDSQMELSGDVRGLLGAKINADRLKVREMYRRIKDIESRLPNAPVARVDLTDISIAALFDSYAITVVNLLGEIWLCGNRKADGEGGRKEPPTRRLRREINGYIESMPWMIPVLKWRNKVAAHPAAIDPRSASESPADRDISLMPTAVGEENGRYVVPVLTPMRRDWSVDDNTPTLVKWSLTQNWEQLLSRFPWLDDDDFIEIGYPLGPDRGLSGQSPEGVDLEKFILAWKGNLPRGVSMTVFMGAQEDGSGGLRMKIRKNDNGTLAITPMIDGRSLSPSWVREGSKVLPDGTIVINPEPH